MKIGIGRVGVSNSFYSSRSSLSKAYGYLSAAQLKTIVTAQNSIINQLTHGTTKLSRDHDDTLPNA